MSIKQITLKDGSKRYFAVVYLSERGKYIYGSRRKLRKEAINDEIMLKTDIINDSFVDETKRTLNEITETFLEIIAPNQMNSNTLYTYKSLYKSNLKDEIGYKPLTKITSFEIQKLWDIKSRELSSSSIIKLHVLLNKVFKQAIKWQLVKNNPMENVIKPKIKYETRKTWTLEEARMFLTEAKKHQSFIVFWLVINTGMRFSEVLGLTWDCIDFENQLIIVKQQLDRTTKEIVSHTKTNASMREIACSKEQIDFLKQHKLHQKNKTNLVCDNSIGGPFCQRNIRRAIDVICNKINIEKITFHDIRHTHATLLVEMGEPIKYIQERLGHKDITTTLNTYVHTNKSHHQSTADNFSKVLDFK